MKSAILAALLSIFAFPFSIHADPDQPVAESVPAPTVSQVITKINLNQADVETLTQSFKGIGRKRAEAIVAYRQTNGEFKGVDDLALVKGIGKAFVARNLTQLQEVYSVTE